MNEEIEYAEMLEIPVSTINVVRKGRHHKKADRSSVLNYAHSEEPLKDTVLANVNDRLRENASGTSQDRLPLEVNFPQEGDVDFDSPERIDTIRLYSSRQGDSLYPNGYEVANNKKEQLPPSKASRVTLGIEFGLACALCGAIFLTNVFVPGSAVNTFFRALNTPAQTTATVRPYTDFTLGSVVSDLSSAELSLSPTGILSCTDDCCVYPAADGVVGEVSKDINGLYTVKVNYSDSFSGVFQGLDVVYYTVGDTVKTNVPIGYTAGEAEVQVTMYSDGTLLSCFELTDENCLAWLPTQNNANE